MSGGMEEGSGGLADGEEGGASLVSLFFIEKENPSQKPPADCPSDSVARTGSC